MFAIVSEDIAGQIIQLFKTKKQAEEFLKELTVAKKLTIEDFTLKKIKNTTT